MGDASLAYDLEERLVPKRRNRGVPQVEGCGDGVLSKVNQGGMDPQECQESKLDHGVIGLTSQLPKRGAQGALQLAHSEDEELAEPKR